MDPPNVAALVEAKDGTGLVEGDVFRQADNVPVEGATNVLELNLWSAFGCFPSVGDGHVRQRR